MPVFTDLLDGTAGQALENRPGWAKPVGDDIVALASTGSGFCLPGGTTAASGTWHAPTSQPASPDQYCEGLLALASSALSCPLGVRCDVTSATGQGYLVQLDNASGRLRLVRRSSAGALTTLGTFTVANVADLDTNKVRLQAVGTAISVLFMGAEVIGPVADAQIATGSVGMLSRGGTLISTAVARIDDWESGEVSTGPAPITGAGAATFAPMTGAGSAALPIGGNGSGSFAPMTGAAAAVLAISGTGQATFAPMTGAATGGPLPIGGAGAASFAAMTGTGTATLIISAAGLATFAPMTGASLGAGGPGQAIGGTGSAAFAPMTGTGTAALKISGAGLATFVPMTGTARGRVGLPVPVVWLTIEADAIDLAIDAEPINLTITIAGDRTVKTLPTKTPEAVFRVTMNMPDWVTPDNPVVDLELLPVRGDVVLADAEVLTATRAQFWISGGTPGRLSTFTALAHLADGQKYPQSLRVMVRETV